MKKLFLTAVVFTVLLFIGCQENSITDPISTESISKNQNPVTNVTRGSFPLEGILVNPAGLNSYIAINGSINYVHEKVFVSVPPMQQYSISVKLSANAVLTDPNLQINNSWTISAESEDIFYVSEEGIYILEKSFPVLGRTDGLVLVCRFLVTTDGVGLNAKWLSYTDKNEMNKENIPIGQLPMPPVKINNFQ
jgi:hypothetical protein